MRVGTKAHKSMRVQYERGVHFPVKAVLSISNWQTFCAEKNGNLLKKNNMNQFFKPLSMQSYGLFFALLISLLGSGCKGRCKKL